MDEAVRLGADMVATGHYCRKEQFTDAAGKTVYRILEGVIPARTRAIFSVSSVRPASRALFPIGHLLKSQVRELAVEAACHRLPRRTHRGYALSVRSICLNF